MSDWYSTFVSNGSKRPFGFNNIYNNYLKPYIGTFFDDLMGKTQMENTQQSLTTQMNYDQYLKRGNERALRDWHLNLPGREIRYPEFSYPGQIMRADTSIARAGLDYDTARANYTGNVLYRSAGLYGIGTRLFRTL